MGGQHHRPAGAEADRREALADPARRQDHLVAVLQEAPLLAGREADRHLAAFGGLEQAAIGIRVRARQGAGAEKVARAQVAAAAGMVGDHLRHRPVHVPGVGPRDPVRACAGLARRRGGEPDLQFEIEGAACLVGRVEEVGQGGGIARGPRRLSGAERRQRLRRDDPGRDRGGEALAEERPEGLVLPALDVPADQSLSRQKPATFPAASAIGTGAPRSLPGPIHTPSSSS